MRKNLAKMSKRTRKTTKSGHTQIPPVENAHAVRTRTTEPRKMFLEIYI